MWLDCFGVRPQSEASTALWMGAMHQHSKLINQQPQSGFDLQPNVAGFAATLG